MTLCRRRRLRADGTWGPRSKDGKGGGCFPRPLPATRGPFSAEGVGAASPRSGAARTPCALGRLQHEPAQEPPTPHGSGGPRGCGALVSDAVIRDALSLFFELGAGAPVVGGLDPDVASPALGPQPPTRASAQSPGRPQGDLAVQRRFWNWTKHRRDGGERSREEALRTDRSPSHQRVHSSEATPTLRGHLRFSAQSQRERQEGWHHGNL